MIKKALVFFLLLPAIILACGENEGPLGVAVGDKVKVVFEGGGAISKAEVLDFTSDSITVRKITNTYYGETMVVPIERVKMLTVISKVPR